MATTSFLERRYVEAPEQIKQYLSAVIGRAKGPFGSGFPAASNNQSLSSADAQRHQCT